MIQAYYRERGWDEEGIVPSSFLTALALEAWSDES
jgi:hypothetical protein